MHQTEMFIIFFYTWYEKSEEINVMQTFVNTEHEACVCFQAEYQL